MIKKKYSEAIRSALYYLLKKDKNFHILGQGVNSPWYVGGTIDKLDKLYPKRVLETPVSENLISGVGIGSSMLGVNCLIIHPRMDFMLYAMDSIVNQGAKWNYITGGSVNSSVTIRGIINRGGSQGAQHSQSLHSIFGHFPGLRVVMPYSVKDAHDLLIAAVNCKDPVIYIDDRWLYETESKFRPEYNLKLKNIKPRVIKKGKDITIVASSFLTHLAIETSKDLILKNISVEIIDLRVISPLNIDAIIKSVKKTRRLLVLDGSHEQCGFANNLIGCVIKKINLKKLKINPQVITLPNTPAPSSAILENLYYPNKKKIFYKIIKMLKLN
jgi:pyruvate/2-oxoglutarate/acetoin dehydrogenase E1 component